MRAMAKRLSGLPIRLRLTLAVVTSMALVFAALGIFIYVQFRHDVLRTLDDGLQSRLRDVAALAHDQFPPDLDRLAQVYCANGVLLSTSKDLEGARLLTARAA